MMSSRFQRGISLIEILITVLILGIGLLGVAALQLTSINTNQGGYFRSQATAIAEDLAGRMRAASIRTYDGVSGFPEFSAAYVGAGPYACDAALAASCNGANCTIAQLGAFDRWESCDQARTLLPEGEVFVTNPGGSRLRLAVAWTPISARQDLGQIELVNNQCAGLGVAAEKDCVILEFIP